MVERFMSKDRQQWGVDWWEFGIWLCLTFMHAIKDLVCLSFILEARVEREDPYKAEFLTSMLLMVFSNGRW